MALSKKARPLVVIACVVTLLAGWLLIVSPLHSHSDEAPSFITRAEQDSVTAIHSQRHHGVHGLRRRERHDFVRVENGVAVPLQKTSFDATTSKRRRDGTVESFHGNEEKRTVIEAQQQQQQQQQLTDEVMKTAVATPSPPPPPPVPTAPFVSKSPVVTAVWAMLTRARHPSTPFNTIIPLLITPVFHDADVLVSMLMSINVPVYQIAFAWNGNDANAKELLSDLQTIPIEGAIQVSHNPNNAGFAASINFGLRVGMARPAPTCAWFFIVNCDVTFPVETLPALVERVAKEDLSTLGMLYGPAIDHYAFVVSRKAVEVAGTMDENFFPAYYEDIDWRWRFNLAGFREVVTGLHVDHIRSINLQRVDHTYHMMHHRSGGGWTYGNAKWGEVRDNRIHDRYPPSGWRTPFGIRNFPLHLWVKDEERLECLRTGRGGPTHPNGRCWYNGAKVLPPHLEAGATIPRFLQKPHHESFSPI